MSSSSNADVRLNAPSGQSASDMERSGWCSPVGMSLLLLGVLVLLPLGGVVFAAWREAGRPGAAGGRTPFEIRSFNLLVRTLLLGICAGVGGTVLGLVAAHAIAVQRLGRQAWFLAAMTLPMLIPPFIHAMSWILLATRWGIPAHGFWPAVVVLSLSLWPIAAWINWSGATHLEGTLLDAARLGRNGTWSLARIRFGLLRPHIVSAVLFTTLFSLSDYGVPSLFRLNTYPVSVFSEFAAHQDLRRGLITAWPYLLIPAIALVVWIRRIPPRVFESFGPHFRASQCPGRKFVRVGSAGVFLLILIASALVPVLSLAGAMKGLSSLVHAWETAQSQVWTSLGLSAAAGLLAAATGLVPAWALLQHRGWKRRLLEYLSLLPVALPGTLFGLGLLHLWNRPAFRFLDEAPVLVLLLCLGRFLPFAIHAERAGLGTVDRALWDAARLSPARGRIAWIWRILIPVAAPSAVVGGALVFVLSLHELAGTLLVVPPGYETLSVRIYSLYHYGASDLVAALSLLLGILGIGILGATTGLWRWLTAHWR